MALYEADCILAVGVRFDDRVTGKVSQFAPHAKIIHIDVDESEIDKIVKVKWPIIGDAQKCLKKLAKEIRLYISEGHNKRKKDAEIWWQQIKGWQEEQPLKYKKSKSVIKPQDVIVEVYQQTKGDVIVATDVGQHQMWTAQYFPIKKPREFLTSGGLGTMGYGLPAAIGGQFGRPDKQVVAFVGDGSFQMTMQEMASLMEDQIPVKVVLLNNASLGMVRQWQGLFYEERYMETDITVSCDFLKIAEAYKVKARRVKKPKELAEAVEEMLATKESFLLEVVVDKDEHVYPMVPAGGASKDMLVMPE
jgi:acetolactate synthase-1/2/3 large subunit